MYPRLAGAALLALLYAATLLGATPIGALLADPLHIDFPDPLPDFSLTERSGKIVHLSDLRGKVWVAAFFFTECAGGCPTVSASMQRLQKDLAGVRDVVLVSFSVNPKSDTPERLRDYAKDLGA